LAQAKTRAELRAEQLVQVRRYSADRSTRRTQEQDMWKGRVHFVGRPLCEPSPQWSSLEFCSDDWKMTSSYVALGKNALLSVGMAGRPPGRDLHSAGT
jgi:hypothetical protein